MRFSSIFVVLPVLATLSSPSFAYDNVLLISIDTLRADYLGCYGSSKVKTPNIDSLAKNGVIFKNTVSQAPFTLPSHVSMLTGLIPPVHGVQDNGGFYLNKSIVTMADVLRSHGIRTAAFLGAFPLDSRFGLDKSFDVYDDSYPTVNNVSEISMPQRKAEEVADFALKWLQGQTKGGWFAFVHFYDPHFPYEPPVQYKQMYPNDLYAGEIAYTDEQVGRILNFLRNNGLNKKTLVVLVSDHGESLGEHQEETHGIFAYESTLRVPFIVSPNTPKVIEARVRLIDVAPTILALQKLRFPERIQGVSLATYLEPGAKGSPVLQDSYFEALSMHFNAQWAPLRGFYSGNFHYIDLPIPELYDLSRDPKEAKNLCEDKTLCGRWAGRFATFAKPFLRSNTSPSPIDSETAEQLRALGYVSGEKIISKKEFGPDQDPKRLIKYHNMVDTALGFYRRGYDLKALEILGKVIEERPDYSVAYLHAGFVYSEQGFPEKGAEILKQAIQNGVLGPEILGKLGLYLFEAKQYDESVKQLELALKTDSQDLDTLNFLAMAYTASGRYSEAESTFQKALAIDPSDAMTLNNLGTLYLTQKKLDLAANQFEAALSKNPHVTGAYNGLGVIYATQRKWNQAIEKWNLALKENSKNYDAMLNLAFAYLEQKDRVKALPLFQNFEKNAPAARYGKDLVKVRSLIRQLE
jgi:arylsulfatase A-like enzyme/Tfp pilus assembly protein PilF